MDNQTEKFLNNKKQNYYDNLSESEKARITESFAEYLKEDKSSQSQVDLQAKATEYYDNLTDDEKKNFTETIIEVMKEKSAPILPISDIIEDFDFKNYIKEIPENVIEQIKESLSKIIEESAQVQKTVFSKITSKANISMEGLESITKNIKDIDVDIKDFENDTGNKYRRK